MLFAFKQVSFSYPATSATEEAIGGAFALQNVSFTLADGEVFGVAGPVGSGKSTLAKLANGLLTPTAGQVLLDGTNLASREAAQARGKVGLVFQYPERQLFADTVLKDVSFGPKNLGWKADKVRQSAQNALRLVGLGSEIENISPFALSGGQQRRVALAGILAMEPHVLVMDEPSVGLDPCAHAAFNALIGDLQRQGMALVLITHNMDDLAALCDKVLLLENGATAAYDTPARVFSQPQLLNRLGLEQPFAQAFAQDLGLPGFYPTIDALADALAQRLA